MSWLILKNYPRDVTRIWSAAIIKDAYGVDFIRLARERCASTGAMVNELERYPDLDGRHTIGDKGRP